MKEYKQFEEHIAHKFEDYQPQVDDAMIWNSIKGEIAPKKKRRLFIFWLFGLIFLVGAAYSILQFSTKETKVSQNLGSKKTSLTQENNATIPKENSNREIAPKSPIYSLEENTNQKVIGFNETKINKIKAYSNPNAFKKSNINKIATPSIFETEQNSLVRNETSILKNNTTTAKASKINIRQMIFPMASISTLEINPIINNNKFKAALNSQLSQITLITKNSSTQKIALLLGTSMYKPYNAYSGMDTELLDLRNSQEKPLEAIQAEFGILFGIGQRLSVQTGLRYLSMQEESSYTTITQNIQTTEEHVVDDQDQLQLIKTTITETNSKNVFRYNTSTNISLPLLVNYEIISSGSNKLKLGVGLEKSLSTTRNGFELDAIGKEYDLSQDTELRYKNSLGDYFLLNAYYNKYLGNHWSLYFGLEAKYGLTNITTSNSLLDKKYNFLGLSLGTNYHF